MIPSYRTSSRTFAFWQLLFRIFTDIITTALPFMTRLTEMSISPTKPLSNTTTELAFKFYKIFSMFWTILNWNITAARTYQLFWFKRTSSCICFIHCSHTIFSSSKIWLFALETHEICIDYHRIFLRFTIIRRVLIL